MNSNHVDLITEPNLLRSLATGAIPRLFQTFNDNTEFTFELIDRHERLAIKADYQDIRGGNKDYTENGKYKG
jgi:hypothetical protein